MTLRDDGLATLRTVDRDLGDLTGSAEQEFVPVGALLGESAAAITGIGDALNRLGRDLQGEEALESVAELNRAVERIHDMHTAAGTTAALPGLAADAEEISKHLETLRRIVAEITALAINGKIQAALVATAGVDFTVFTAEIGRLGNMAAQQIENAVARLSEVRSSISGAIQAESAFVRNEAGELKNIRSRVESNIALMVDRGRRASHALDAVREKSGQVASKVAQTVGELQINDIVCQRIEHVRIVLRTLAAREDAWLRDMEDERFHRLATAALRLQCRQLDEAALDYLREIEALAANLRGLSSDAADLMAEAESAFGDSHGGIFLTEIEGDIDRASALLDAYSAADQRTRSMVTDVSQGFIDMTKDLESIRSIDADMRVMGLNATLKTGRLGNAGQALGVVAAELRACSRRTEDSSRMVETLLTKALESAQQLNRQSTKAMLEVEFDNTHPCRSIMNSCVAGLHQLSATMAQTLESLRHDAPAVAERLANGAGSISFHHRLKNDCERASQLVARMAEQMGNGHTPDQAEFDDLRRLAERNYTMDSERLIHDQFDGRTSETLASQAGSSEVADSIDDLFF